MAIKCAVLSAGCGCIAGCMMLSTAFSAPGNPVAKTVAADFAAQSGAKVWHYAVPPMSEIQRLPDVYPTDGTPNGVVRIAVKLYLYGLAQKIYLHRRAEAVLGFDKGALLRNLLDKLLVSLLLVAQTAHESAAASRNFCGVEGEGLDLCHLG